MRIGIQGGKIVDGGFPSPRHAPLNSPPRHVAPAVSPSGPPVLQFLGIDWYYWAIIAAILIGVVVYVLA